MKVTNIKTYSTEFKYALVFDDSDNLYDQIEWCKSTFGPSYGSTSGYKSYRWISGYKSIRFRNESDRTFFLLRWSGQ